MGTVRGPGGNSAAASVQRGWWCLPCLSNRVIGGTKENVRRGASEAQVFCTRDAGFPWTRLAYGESRFLLLSSPSLSLRLWSKDPLSTEEIHNRCLVHLLPGFLLIMPHSFPHQLSWSPWKMKSHGTIQRKTTFVFSCTSTWYILVVTAFPSSPPFPPSLPPFPLSLSHLLPSLWDRPGFLDSLINRNW